MDCSSHTLKQLVMQKLDSFSAMRERCYRIDWIKVFLFGMMVYVFYASIFGSGLIKIESAEQIDKTIVDEIVDEVIKDKGLILEGNNKLKKSFVKEPHKASVLGFLDLGSKKKKKSLRRTAFFDQNGKEIKSFIKRFVHVAINEQKKYGVPASITLANSLLNSDVGKRKMTKRSNNYFAIPCTEKWKGKKLDAETCYRAYESAWSSFRDHSVFLTKELKLSSLYDEDYKAWAKALEASGKFDTKDLEKNLIKVIEQLELYRFDEE